jgi:hypothetical protein
MVLLQLLTGSTVIATDCRLKISFYYHGLFVSFIIFLTDFNISKKHHGATDISKRSGILDRH